MQRKLMLFILVLMQAPVAVAHKASEQAVTEPVTRMEVFNHALPKLDYRKVDVINVIYAPGAASPRHRHEVAVFAYVLKGAVESQLQGEELKTFKAGEMWWEPPGTTHVVSRNVSKTEPATLLVFYVGEQGKAVYRVLKK